MTRPSATSPWFRKQRREKPIVNNVHAVLSKRQRAYSVFQPAPHTDFPLFQVIRVLPDQVERSNSPLSTQINLKSTFERLSNDPNIHEADRNVIGAFLREFNRTALEHSDQIPPETHYVSEESLSRAGVNLSSPTGFRAGFAVSRARTTSREVRLRRHFSETYTGGLELHTLIQRHAQPLFRHILLELYNTEDFPCAPHERGLLAIVTTRIVSTIGLHTTAETRTFAFLRAGDEAGLINGEVGGGSSRFFQRRYEDLYGVSGLRFIVFPIECIEEGTWRVYGSINVCNSDISEDDGTFTEDTRNSDSFYRARKWVLGEAELRNGSNSMTVQRSFSVPMRRFSSYTKDVIHFSIAGNSNDNDRQASLPYVDVSLTNISVPCVEVDIRPLLNEFAQTQCRLASYYRKTALGDGMQLTHSVNLLRRALRIFCFESTVRALYDLSGFYVYGLGVNQDFGMAKILRYCASGLRRNYNSRAIWLNHLALEMAHYHSMAIERRIISLVLFSRRTLTSLSRGLGHWRIGDWRIATTLPSDIANGELGSHYSRPARCKQSHVVSRRSESPYLSLFDTPGLRDGLCSDLTLFDTPGLDLDTQKWRISSDIHSLPQKHVLQLRYGKRQELIPISMSYRFGKQESHEDVLRIMSELLKVGFGLDLDTQLIPISMSYRFGKQESHEDGLRIMSELLKVGFSLDLDTEVGDQFCYTFAAPEICAPAAVRKKARANSDKHAIPIREARKS